MSGGGRMTRNEAIKYIRNVLKGREDKRGKTEIDIALEMAIKALEQEPCDDAISRQAVLDEMYKRQEDGDAITVGFIKKLPSVTVQPKM